jgi:hypothetical protein
MNRSKHTKELPWTPCSRLLVGGYGDMGLRDFGVLLGAITLARLASAYAKPRDARIVRSFLASRRAPHA